MRLRGLVIFMLAGIAAVSATVPLPAVAQAPPQTIGIRLLDAPENRANDPRARQYIVDHVAPGTTISRRVEIGNQTSKTQVVQVYAAAANIKDGSFIAGEGRSANDLTSWTTVDPPTVGPPPGGKVPATVKIVVPANASPGERYGAVWAELPAAVPEGGGVGTINRVGVRIYLSVGPGGEPASDFSITTFEARRDPQGNPVVAATVHNTGGRAIDLSGELKLTNGPGGLSAGPFPARLGTTLGVGQTEPVLVALDRALPAGPWDARIMLRSGTTTREATATITFPAAPAASAGPVATSSPSRRTWPILVGVALIVGVLLLLVWLVRRKRQPEPGR